MQLLMIKLQRAILDSNFIPCESWDGREDWESKRAEHLLKSDCLYEVLENSIGSQALTSLLNNALDNPGPLRYQFDRIVVDFISQNHRFLNTLAKFCPFLRRFYKFIIDEREWLLGWTPDGLTIEQQDKYLDRGRMGLITEVAMSKDKLVFNAVASYVGNEYDELVNKANHEYSEGLSI